MKGRAKDRTPIKHAWVATRMSEGKAVKSGKTAAVAKTLQEELVKRMKGSKVPKWIQNVASSAAPTVRKVSSALAHMNQRLSSCKNTREKDLSIAFDTCLLPIDSRQNLIRDFHLFTSQAKYLIVVSTEPWQPESGGVGNGDGVANGDGLGNGLGSGLGNGLGSGLGYGIAPVTHSPWSSQSQSQFQSNSNRSSFGATPNNTEFIGSGVYDSITHLENVVCMYV